MTEPIKKSASRTKEYFEVARKRGMRSLDEISAKSLLRDFYISVPRGCQVLDIDIDLHQLRDLSPPWALKVLSPDIQHKSDEGFVALSLSDVDQVRAGIGRMTNKAQTAGYRIEGFLVEEMVKPGIEVVVGGFHDSCFGPTIMFGLGGIFIEVLGDVSFRVCPIDDLDAEEMIAELSGRTVFEGARGGVKADRSTLINLLLAIGGENGLLMDANDEIEEIDLNPVIINGAEAVAVGALMILSERAAA